MALGCSFLCSFGSPVTRAQTVHLGSTLEGHIGRVATRSNDQQKIQRQARTNPAVRVTAAVVAAGRTHCCVASAAYRECHLMWCTIPPLLLGACSET
jgi:hypothetical protein